jgi:hypothetical protein
MKYQGETLEQLKDKKLKQVLLGEEGYHCGGVVK